MLALAAFEKTIIYSIEENSQSWQRENGSGSIIYRVFTGRVDTLPSVRLSGSHSTMLKPISFPSTNLQTCTCVHVCARCMCVPQKGRVTGGGWEREIQFRVFS